MRPHVLILSGLYDFSTDLVALQLQRAGINYVRLNREQLADHRLTLDPLVPELIIHGPSGNWTFWELLARNWFPSGSVRLFSYETLLRLHFHRWNS